MYLQHFGLRREPFTMTPDPAAMLLTPNYREAIAALSYGAIDRKGVVVLTGEAGTGKTTLLRRLVDLAAASRTRCGVIFHPLLTANEFLELVLLNLGINEIPVSKAQRLLKLESLLVEIHRNGQTAVLIIDEAHRMSPELFEEVRLLSNFETSNQKLLQIVLSGQPELGVALASPDLWRFKQRVAVRLHLNPLTPSETRQLIEHRWKHAKGSEPAPFDEEALQLIELCSQGIPRVIHAICSNALLQAVGSDSKTVSGDAVLQAIVDLDLPVPLRRIQLEDPIRTAARLAWSRQRALLPAANEPKMATTSQPIQEQPEPETVYADASKPVTQAERRPDYTTEPVVEPRWRPQLAETSPGGAPAPAITIVAERPQTSRVTEMPAVFTRIPAELPSADQSPTLAGAQAKADKPRNMTYSLPKLQRFEPEKDHPKPFRRLISMLGLAQ